MTLEETKKLLMAIDAMYPSFDVKNPIATAEAWHWALEEYPAEAVKASLQIYLKTSQSGFAPSVSQLIDGIHKPADKDRLTEGEAWALVKKALADSGYNAKERFEELPPEVQKAVGGVEILRQWGMTDSDEVNTVIMSNFQRTYKAVISQKEYADRVPAALSDLVKSLADRKAPENRLNG